MRGLDPLALSNLSLPAKWLGVFMAVHENRKGEVTATLSEIRAWTSLSTRTIQYGLEDLQHAGFISVITPFQRTANSSAKFAFTLRDASGASPVSPVVTQEMRQVVSENAENDAEAVDSLASARRSSPPLIPSGSLSSPEVLENKELGREGISITREQGELISTDVPVWLVDLRTTPGYNIDRVHEMKLIDRVRDAGISPARLCETATAIAAKWESIRWSPSNKGGYKKIDLTFVAWAKREGFNGNGKSSNGRYRAPGTDVPKGGTPEAYARWPAQEWPE